MNVLPRPRTNFLHAQAKLESFLLRDSADEVVRTAVIQAFEYTFEAAWKLARSAAELAGIPAPGPRPALTAGISLGLLRAEDEQTWLEMMADRNLTVPTYNEVLAAQPYRKICELYAPTFRRLPESVS